jgi:hypothetical protein
VETLGADFLATAFFFVLVPLLVSCGAAAANAPNTMANANAKAIPCFIFPPSRFKMDNQQNIDATSFAGRLGLLMLAAIY